MWNKYSSIHTREIYASKCHLFLILIWLLPKQCYRTGYNKGYVLIKWYFIYILCRCFPERSWMPVIQQKTSQNGSDPTLPKTLRFYKQFLADITSKIPVLLASTSDTVEVFPASTLVCTVHSWLVPNNLGPWKVPIKYNFLIWSKIAVFDTFLLTFVFMQAKIQVVMFQKISHGCTYFFVHNWNHQYYAL